MREPKNTMTKKAMRERTLTSMDMQELSARKRNPPTKELTRMVNSRLTRPRKRDTMILHTLWITLTLATVSMVRRSLEKTRPCMVLIMALIINLFWGTKKTANISNIIHTTCPSLVDKIVLYKHYLLTNVLMYIIYVCYVKLYLSSCLLFTTNAMKRGYES